ncbi:MAG TPA: hypothetical protein VK464_28810 [Symbiobacteriaceae bacterium]|jgi:hypothetical protein|nr:hypothetical protein [Symbiobacteriaceae bacterium]
MDDKNQRYKAQRNQEPITIDTDPTGNNPAGNYLGGVTADQGKLPPVESTADIWIMQEDQAKQGMARKFDTKHAQAAPGHPHIGHQAGSGESQ